MSSWGYSRDSQELHSKYSERQEPIFSFASYSSSVDTQITPVFSGGVGRSGTTIVGRILKKNSDLFAGSPYEIKFITESFGLIDLVYGQRKFLPTQISRKGYLLSKVGQFDSIKIRYSKFRKRVHDDWWSRTNRLGVESGLHRALKKSQMNELLDELEASLDTPTQAARNFVFGYIKKHRRWTGQKYWMDTTPANMMYADFVYKLFPEAKFIEMRRDPLDNIASVLKEPWGPNTAERAIPWWSDRIALATTAKAAIPEGSHLTLELEDLVLRARDESYQRLINHVGLADEAAMRQYFDDEVTSERANFGRWRKDFSDPEAFLALFNQLKR